MVMAMPLIIWQALKLSIIRRLTVFKKPNPSSRNTIRASMYSWFDMLCFNLIHKRLNKITGGRIKLIYPDNREEILGKEGDIINFKLNNYEVFRKLILKGSVGFGESYVNKDWDTDRLADFLKLMLDNYNVLAEDKLNKLKIFRYIEDVKHWLRKNNLLYSSAYFKHKEQSLEEAQLEKVDLLINKARIQRGQKVLEIGSGWGACANRMALNHDCQVTSITLSNEQCKEAQNRANALGIGKQVKFEIKDYREISEKYDRIVSIEMLEAVGADNLNTYFKKCEEALNPDGILAVQVIAYPDTHYKSYLGKSDWINRHIFPGSHLPSLGALLEAASKNNLVIEHVENMAEHYALTLKLWLERFDQKLDQVKEFGFNEGFIRKWRFYLAVCEAEFASRWISVYQVVFTRPNSKLESKENVYKLYKVA
jgi:cyclopropane-fatty-acyl-phospholipid synthase